MDPPEGTDMNDLDFIDSIIAQADAAGIDASHVSTVEQALDLADVLAALA